MIQNKTILLILLLLIEIKFKQMKVKLVAYGITKDILEGKNLDFELDGQSIGDLKNQLCSRYPKLEDLKSIRFAVNDTYAEEEQLVQENDEIILIPPVSGG